MRGLIAEGNPGSSPKSVGDLERSAGVSWLPEILGAPELLLLQSWGHHHLRCPLRAINHPVCPLRAINHPVCCP